VNLLQIAADDAHMSADDGGAGLQGNGRLDEPAPTSEWLESWGLSGWLGFWVGKRLPFFCRVIAHTDSYHISRPLI
jgi:hypothetical protein